MLEIEVLALPTEVCNPCIALLSVLKLDVVGRDPMALVTLLNPAATVDDRAVTEEAVARPLVAEVMAPLMAVVAEVTSAVFARPVVAVVMAVVMAVWLAVMAVVMAPKSVAMVVQVAVKFLDMLWPRAARPVDEATWLLTVNPAVP